MTTPSKLLYMTAEEYLAFEERASVKHEYVDGRIFAMSGVTRRHNVIACNIYSLLRPHLRGGRCRAYVADVKVKVEPTNSFYYPDVMVSCDEYDDKSVFTDSPVLIAEVLSRSTATIDRREKVLAYRRLESLREYLIVHQRKKSVELHRKNKSGDWEIFEFGQSGELALEVLKYSPAGAIRISMDEIYEDVNVPSLDDGMVREEVIAEEEWLAAETLDW